MKYVKTFEKYNEELLLEKLNLKEHIFNFKNKVNKKASANIIIGLLLSILTLSQTINFIQNNFNTEDKKTLIDIVEKYENNTHDPRYMTLSANGLKNIKNHEKLALVAYSIGDDKITIGYGHAEKLETSKYKIGDEISINDALLLLRYDLKNAENGIIRMFKQWKNEENISIKLTQSQFDTLVSMAYNIGISGLRSTEFIKQIKNNNLDAAANLIKNTKLKKGFSGLKDRRNIEYNMFVSE